MVKTLEEALKNESKRLKIPTDIRSYDIGYRVISKNGNILALRNGASVFALPSEAKKAVKREFGKDDPSFDIGRYKIEEVAIVNFEKLKKFLDVPNIIKEMTLAQDILFGLGASWLFYEGDGK